MKQQVTGRGLVARTVVSIQITACILMAGCGGSVKFSSQTIMDENGDVVRSTQLSASGDSAYEKLQSIYDLPSGGTWVEIEEDSSETTDESAAPTPFYSRVYEVTRSYAAGESIAPDFTRRGNSATNVASNRVVTRVRHYWFADTYQYEETFKDSVTEASFSAAVRRLYITYIQALAEEIAGLPNADFTTQEALDRLRARADPIVERFLNVFGANCVDDLATLETCGDAISQDPELGAYGDVFDDEDFLLGELVAIFPPPAAVDPDDWYDTLNLDALDRLDDLEDLREVFDTLDEDLLGVHGLVLFESYPFELSLSLPGNYVASNADVRGPGVLSWSFKSEDFLLHEHTLYARSRIVHWNRVLLALTLLVAFFGIFWTKLDSKT